MKNANITDPTEITKAIERAEFVKKEIEALYVWDFSLLSSSASVIPVTEIHNLLYHLPP